MGTFVGRPISINGMAYAPTNEQGVVFLFGRLAPKLGFHIENVQVRCPDCTARRNGRLERIEFEYWASDFERHEHPPKSADIIVCWENDWEYRPNKYKHIEIIGLKKHVGASPRIFTVGCAETRAGDELDSVSNTEWNIPVSAQLGDLIMMYRTLPASEIRDLWKIVGPFQTFGKRNKEGRWPGLQTGLRLVTRLKTPLTYSSLKNDPTTKHLGVVKKRFMGKSDITEDWPLLYEMIVARNPKVKSLLRDWMVD